MESLKIPRGNDFYLMAPVRKIVFSEDGSGRKLKTGVRINMVDFTSLSVRLHESDDVCGMPLHFTISEDDESKLIIKVPGKMLREGWYGIDIIGVFEGRNVRSSENKTFKIVERNSNSSVSGMMYEGDKSYPIDTMWMLYACPRYPHLYIDLETMKLKQKGTVENGRMYMRDGKLYMHVDD